MSKNWSEEWPKEAGYYWHYGIRHASDECKLRVAHFYQTTMGVSCCCNNMIVWKGRAKGLWQLIPTPETPSLLDVMLAVAQKD